MVKGKNNIFNVFRSRYANTYVKGESTRVLLKTRRLGKNFQKNFVSKMFASEFKWKIVFGFFP